MPSHSMASEHHPLLHNFCIFSRAQGAMAARTASTVVPTCDSRVELPGTAPATVNRALLGSLTASYIDAPGGARVTPATPQACCSLLVPLEGRLRVHTSESDAEATPAAPYLRAPTREAHLSTPSARFLMLDLPAERIAAAAAGATTPHHACATGEHAACLIRLAQKLATAADRFPGLTTLQRLATAQRKALTPKPVLQIEDQLIKQVAAATTADLVTKTAPAHHRFGDVSQLIAELRSSPTLPTTVRELAAWTGMSVAVLQREFRKTGHSPHAFLHGLRLDRARAALLAPTPETTAADVAHACGIQHLGRFSQYYRERFGECPSETLRRALSRARASKHGGGAACDAYSS